MLQSHCDGYQTLMGESRLFPRMNVNHKGSQHIFNRPKAGRASTTSNNNKQQPND